MPEVTISEYTLRKRANSACENSDWNLKKNEVKITATIISAIS